MISQKPFSRRVKVDALPREGLTQTIEATPAERAAIAEQNGLVEVAQLTATFSLRRAGRAVRVQGSVHAQVTQTCVVTLEPIPASLDESVDVRFAPPADEKPGGRAGPETLETDLEDAPDPIVDGKIDRGALAVEFMALGLDPYPRRPGAQFAPPSDALPDPSPFDALAEIARKKG